MSDFGKAEALRKLRLTCVRCRKSTGFRDKRVGGAVAHRWLSNPSKMSQVIIACEDFERK